MSLMEQQCYEHSQVGPEQKRGKLQTLDKEQHQEGQKELLSEIRPNSFKYDQRNS